MKRFFPAICLLILLLQISMAGKAQVAPIQKYKIAVFLPLYLDSAFDDAGNYRYDKNFPKFISPGLEFYEGMQLAIDSLNNQQAALEFLVFDTKAVNKSIEDREHDSAFSGISLIIGHVNQAEERQLAALAARQQVPFINVNYPNDGGISNNPNLVVLNSTLKTHCEAIYKFVQRNYPLYNILYIRKKGALEDRLRNYFSDIEKTTTSIPMHIKYLNVDDGVDMKQILPSLDSNLKTICIVGSLDENFGRTVCARFAATGKTYRSKIFGMPTWDAINDFSGTAYADQEIYYTTPFYINPADSLVQSVQQFFRDKFYMRPSDQIFRGYEVTLHFAQLLVANAGHLSGNIGQKRFKVFNDFDIQPVFLDKQAMNLDYFENRKLYFVKKVNGTVTAVY